MTDKERMLAGKLYLASDPELVADHRRRDELQRKLNTAVGGKEILAAAKELLGAMGEDSWIQPPFYCDYGSHIRVGRHFYANFDCIILDVCDVTIGDDVFLAPRVCIYTATHPIDAATRNSELEYGKPVTIGSSVWIGGNTVLCPGVAIGDNVVIGAGSVVTHDIPSGVVAAGNPCRVLRPITDAEAAHWQALAKEYWAEMGAEGEKP